MKISTGITLAAAIVAATGIIITAVMLARPEFGEGRGANAEALPGASPVERRGGWPMFRGGQSLLGTAPDWLADGLEVVWKFKTGGAVKSSPAVEGGLVYVGSDDANMYAIDLAR